MALIAVSISVMGQVTFTAIEGSDWTDAEGSAKAFDGNLNTKWCKGSSRYVDKCYLMLEASEATYIQGFKMTTANDNTDDRGRVPGEYTIFGSNNKTQWDVIYHQKEDNLIEDKNFTEYTVYCNSKQKYKYFKLWIKRNATRSYDLKNRLFQLSEFALLPAAFGMTLEAGSAKAMDGDTGEKWEGKTPQTVVVKATSACQLTGYQFTTGNDNRSYRGRNPKDWTVEGSNDQQAWTIIDSKTDDKVMQDKNYYPYFFPVTPPETFLVEARTGRTLAEPVLRVYVKDGVFQIFHEQCWIGLLCGADGCRIKRQPQCCIDTLGDRPQWSRVGDHDACAKPPGARDNALGGANQFYAFSGTFAS